MEGSYQSHEPMELGKSTLDDGQKQPTCGPQNTDFENPIKVDHESQESKSLEAKAKLDNNKRRRSQRQKNRQASLVQRNCYLCTDHSPSDKRDQDSGEIATTFEKSQSGRSTKARGKRRRRRRCQKNDSGAGFTEKSQQDLEEAPVGEDELKDVQANLEQKNIDKSTTLITDLPDDHSCFKVPDPVSDQELDQHLDQVDGANGLDPTVDYDSDKSLSLQLEEDVFADENDKSADLITDDVTTNDILEGVDALATAEAEDLPPPLEDENGCSSVLTPSSIRKVIPLAPDETGRWIKVKGRKSRSPVVKKYVSSSNDEEGVDRIPTPEPVFADDDADYSNTLRTFANNLRAHNLASTHCDNPVLDSETVTNSSSTKKKRVDFSSSRHFLNSSSDEEVNKEPIAPEAEQPVLEDTGHFSGSVQVHANEDVLETTDADSEDLLAGVAFQRPSDLSSRPDLCDKENSVNSRTKKTTKSRGVKNVSKEMKKVQSRKFGKNSSSNKNDECITDGHSHQQPR